MAAFMAESPTSGDFQQQLLFVRWMVEIPANTCHILNFCVTSSLSNLLPFFFSLFLSFILPAFPLVFSFFSFLEQAAQIETNSFKLYFSESNIEWH